MNHSYFRTAFVSLLLPWLIFPDAVSRAWHRRAGVSAPVAPATAQQQIACDQTLSREITASGEQHSFTFNGVADEVVDVSAAATSGTLCAEIQVFSPSGSVIADTRGNFPQATCNTRAGRKRLTETGVYTIRVRDNTLSKTGTYNLNLVSNRCGAAIACGDTKSGSLVPAEQDVYRFNGATGDVINLSAVGTSGNICAAIELLNPAGDLILSTRSFFPQATCNTSTRRVRLPATGAYAVVVSPDSLTRTGGYELNLEFVLGGCKALPSINCGDNKTGNIASRAQQDPYRFTASANEAVSIAAVNSSGNLCAVIELLDPSGAVIADTRSFFPQATCNTGTGSVKLPAAGDYTIIVSPQTLGQTGGYALNLGFTTGRCGAAIAATETKSGDLANRAEQDAFRFFGRQGGTVDISAIGFSPLCVVTELFDPGGTRVTSTLDNFPQATCNTSTGNKTLPATGLYTILLRSSTRIATGPYNVNLFCPGANCSQPPAITLSPASLSLTAGATSQMQVSLNPAQSAPATVTLNSSNPNVASVPGSVTIPANAASAAFTVTGIAPGTATITATLPASLGGGSATASVTVNPPPPIQCTAQIGINPPNPTASDSISTTISGECPTACTPRNPQVTRVGNEIRITTTPPGQFCLQVFTSYSLTIGLGQLAAGTYQVIFIFDGQELARRSFTVAVAPAREVRVASAEGSPGGMVSVPIELVSAGDVNAMGFSLTFNPAILSSPQATPASGAALNSNPTQAAQGRLGMTISLPAGQTFPTGVARVATVTFTIAAGTTATSTPIGFGDQPVAREVVGVSANLLPAVFTPGTVTIIAGLEADVSPRPGGSGVVTVPDWVQVGRFAAGLDTAAAGVEFQRADCSPRLAPDGVTLARGNGAITVSDWVQAGRYAAGLDPPTPAGGPSAPATTLTALSRSDSSAAFAAAAAERILQIVGAATDSESETLVLRLEARGDEAALGFSLRFDPTAWRFVSATAGGDALEAAININAGQAASGRIGVALSLPAGRTFAAGSRELALISFAPASRSPGNPIAVAFDDLPVAREAADAGANVLPLRFATHTRELRQATIVSAASLGETPLAAESIATAFGADLSAVTQSATAFPLPAELGGTQVVIRDSAGIDRPAPLFFVSPAQINFQIPAGTAAGRATVVVTGPGGVTIVGTAHIASVAPALFTADSSGRGAAAALALRIKANGSRSYEPVAVFDPSRRRFVAAPLELGDEHDQVFLVLFGTGLRHRSSLSAVGAKIGGVDAEVDYAGPQVGFAGLDQVNLRIPRSLIGRGEVEIVLSVDGQLANSVRINIAN